MLGSSASGSGGSSQSPVGSMSQLAGGSVSGGGGSLTSDSSGGSGSPPTLLPPLDHPQFVCPRRPNLGREGRPILLRANHFQVRYGIHVGFFSSVGNMYLWNVREPKPPCSLTFVDGAVAKKENSVPASTLGSKKSLKHFYRNNLQLYI